MTIIKLSEQQKEMGLKIGAGILMIAIFYIVLINPASKELTFLRGNIYNTEKRLVLLEEVKKLQNDLTGMSLSLGDVGDSPVILGKISEFAQRDQLDIQSIVPKTQNTGNYVLLRLEVNGQGSFFSLIKFLKDIDAANIFVVRDFSLTQKKTDSSNEDYRGSLKGKPKENLKGDKKLLQVQLVLETYLEQKNKKGPA